MKQRGILMKIGQLVKLHIKKIFHYCDTDHEELEHLMDLTYSKETFGIYFPFCTEVSHIPENQLVRYWIEVYSVGEKKVRVSSQWFEPPRSKSRTLFMQYLVTKEIVTEDELLSDVTIDSDKDNANDKRTRSRRSNVRYKGYPIGNAQNLVIRNILSNLGQESFSEKDWKATKAFFSNCCAYCGKEGYLLMDHAIPINQESAGEHRLGNLVPSCKHCNSAKHHKDFSDFLGNDSERIQKIEEYMNSRNYVHPGDNEQMKKVLGMAYEEVSLIADRYVAVLNLFLNN